MELWALAVAAIGAVAIIRIVLTGAASVDGDGLRRSDQPEVYWTVLIAALLLEAFLLGRGFGFW
jgi:hypothetical protein